MRYDINYFKKGGSSFTNKRQIYNIPNDLITNILKYIDFKRCKDLIKILENTSKLEEYIDYKTINKYYENNFEFSCGFNENLISKIYNNKLCLNLNDKKKNECLKYVYNCYNNYNYKLIAKLKGHEDKIYSIEFNKIGTKIVSSCLGGKIYIWDIIKKDEYSYDLKKSKELKGHTEPVRSVRFNHNGTKILSSDDGTIRIWNIATGESVLIIKNVYGLSSDINNDGTKILGIDVTGKIICVWDSNTGKLLLELKGHTETVWYARFNEDSTKIVSVAWEGAIRVWNIDKNNEQYSVGDSILTIPEGNYSFSSVEINKGKIIATSYNEEIHVFDSNTGELLKILTTGEDYVDKTRFISAFSNDGTKVISGSGSRYAIIDMWNIVDGKHILSLEGNTAVLEPTEFRTVSYPKIDGIISAKFNHDESMIVSGSEHGVINIFGNGYLKKK